jgi:hypothetical protein
MVPLERYPSFGEAGFASQCITRSGMKIPIFDGDIVPVPGGDI